MSLRTIFICLLLIFSASQAFATEHSDAADIAWFKGDVNAAFVEAQKQHKPVLLYWGAVWCPPCQQLKSTVFNRPDFIARITLFIPVYLDGDNFTRLVAQAKCSRKVLRRFKERWQVSGVC